MNSTTYGWDEYGNEAEDIRSGYVGEFKKFGFSGVPKHCLACDGSEVSRETYSELFDVFGETFGAGDGVSTFNLPDLRGAFLRCVGGNAAALGTEQGDAIREISGRVYFRPYKGAEQAEVDSTLFGNTSGPFYKEIGPISNGSGEGPVGEGFATNHGNEILNFDASRVVSVASEVRPINYAVNICVVYE